MPCDNEIAVLNAIRARGSQNFTGPELSRELGLCRQVIYRYIRILNERGHRIEGQPWFGFMAQLLEDEA